jgi:cysteinyl-tRNA synthetase
VQNALRQSLSILEEITAVLGIELEDQALPSRGSELSPAQIAEIEALVALRSEARDAKNWPEADRIRKVLEQDYMVVVKDTPQGASWSLRRESASM